MVVIAEQALLADGSLDWEGIARKLDENTPKYDWPRRVGPKCPKCGGEKCKRQVGDRFRCIYCCYEAHVPRG